MAQTYSDQLTQVRTDLKAALRRDFWGDILKTILFWGIALTVFFFATRENKIVGPYHNLPMFLALALILMAIPVVRMQLWKYRTLLRETRGTIQKKSTGLVRVPRTDRNTGYVTGRDMVAVNALYLTIEKADGSLEKIKIVGNHIFSLTQAYYEEGDEVVRFVGARYPYNPNKKTNRPFCLRCGYIGSPTEARCSRCRSAMLPTGQNNQEP